jgi:hypothetical protein
MVTASHPVMPSPLVTASQTVLPSRLVMASSLATASHPVMASHPVPIAGLERELRRRLGDPRLLYRALRQTAQTQEHVR